MIPVPARSFGILGPLKVHGDGRPIGLRGTNSRRILSLLLVRLPRVVSVDALVDAVWPDDPPANPTGALQVAVSRLRRDLGALGACIRARTPGYVLDVPLESLDVHRFLAAQRSGKDALGRHDPGAALDAFRGALRLWRGPALEDTRDVPTLHHEAQWLDALRRTAEEGRIDCMLALGRHAEVVDDLQRLATAHPLHERFREQLLIALYRSGRQAEALSAYQDARTHSITYRAQEAGTVLQRLHGQILAQDPALAMPGGRSPTPHGSDERLRPGLPPVSSALFGREAILDEVTARTTAGRLVTLTGPAGAGKSRLAVAAAHELAEHWPEGPWLVDLTSASSTPMAKRVFAAALSIPEHAGSSLEEAVGRFLRVRRGLVVLDGCEHVADAVAELVGSVPEAERAVAVLTTSQVPLGVPGEVLVDVPPLAPPSADAGIEAVIENPSVQLFIDRAARTRPGFALTETNAEAIVAICRALDGLPLALELAAPLVRVAEPAAIAERLGDRFGLLTSGPAPLPTRHRSLRAALDWSHELLDDAERCLFRRLSVFVGGAAAGDVQAVCSDADLPASRIPLLLARLAEASLIVLADGGAAGSHRVRLLDTVRDYAASRLREANEEAALRRAHADRLRSVAEEADRELHGPHQQRWADRLAADLGNVRAAMDWSFEEYPEIAVRLAAALWWLCWRETMVEEGLEWSGRALRSGAGDPAVRSRLLLLHAMMRYQHAELPEAVAASEEAIDLVGRTEDYEILAAAHFVRGWFAGLEGDVALLRHHAGQCEELARAHGHDWLVSCGLTVRATGDLLEGDVASAAEQTTTAMDLSARAGDMWGEGLAGWIRSNAGFVSGDIAAAHDAALASVRLALRMRHYGGVVSALHVLAATTALHGDAERGAMLCGAAHALLDAWQLPWQPAEEPFRDAHHDVLDRLLSPERLAELRAHGASLTMAEAVAMAGLGRVGEPPPSP